MTKHKLFARALYAVMALALVAGLTLVPATASASVTGITDVVPSEVSPAYVSPGGSVNVAFTITTDAVEAEDVDVRILIADGTIGDSNVFTVTTSGGPPSTYAVSKTVGISVSAEEGAKYTLTAKARTVGDVEWEIETEDDAVIVDSVAPEVTIDAITEYANPSEITGTASDVASDVASVELLIKDETDNTYWDGISEWGGTETWLAATNTDEWATWSYNAGLPGCWADGHIYTVTARATDEAGNTTVEADRPSATFTADTVAPTVTITTTVDNPTNEAPSVIEGTSTDARSGVKSVNVQVAYDASYYWDGSHWVAAESWVEAEGTTSWSFTMPTLTSGRTYTVKAKATDNADNDSTLGTISFAYDAIAPTVAITAPTEDYYKADFVEIAGTSTAGAAGKVELLLKDNTANKYWDGDSWEDASSWLDATTSDEWVNWVYDVSGLSDDDEENGEFSDGSSYTVTAKATDGLGNYSTAQAIFTYDISAPAVTIDDIADYVASLAEITGTASDAGSGVFSVELLIKDETASEYWTGSAWGAETWLLATNTDEWATWSYDTAEVTFADADGHSYNVTAKATDDLSTVTAEADQPSDSFTLDSLPKVTIVGIADSVSELESITGTATDTAPGSVTLVQLQIKNTTDSTYWTGSAWGAEIWLDAATADEWAAWSFSTSSVSFADGNSYTVSAKSRDNVGQWSDIVEDSFTFDTSGPIVTIKDLPAEARPYTISGVASDVGSGVASVTLTIVRDEDSKYWTGSWVETETWLSATGTAAWTYDVSGVSFDDGKSYTVTAKATDTLNIVTAEADQPSETFTYGGTVTKSTTISLESGWNLISLPLVPTSSNITDVLADLTTVSQVRTFVWEAGNLTQKWWLPGVAASTLSQIVDGQGYWIEMDAADTLVVTGSELPAPPLTPPFYNVYTGWNLVGFKSLDTATAANYLGTAVTSTFEAMYGYNAAAGIYTIIKTSTNLVPGDGYWLAVNADGTIYP